MNNLLKTILIFQCFFPLGCGNELARFNRPTRKNEYSRFRSIKPRKVRDVKHRKYSNNSYKCSVSKLLLDIVGVFIAGTSYLLYKNPSNFHFSLKVFYNRNKNKNPLDIEDLSNPVDTDKDKNSSNNGVYAQHIHKPTYVPYIGGSGSSLTNSNTVKSNISNSDNNNDSTYNQDNIVGNPDTTNTSTNTNTLINDMIEDDKEDNAKGITKINDDTYIDGPIVMREIKSKNGYKNNSVGACATPNVWSKVKEVKEAKKIDYLGMQGIDNSHKPLIKFLNNNNPKINDDNKYVTSKFEEYRNTFKASSELKLGLDFLVNGENGGFKEQENFYFSGADKHNYNKVKAFGCSAGNQNVKVVYNSDNSSSYVLELKTNKKDIRLFIAPQESEFSNIASLHNKITSFRKGIPSKPLDGKFEFPDLKINTGKLHHKGLEGKYFDGELGEYKLEEFYDEFTIDIDKAGAKIKAKSVIVAQAKGCASWHHFTPEYKFNGPFLILIYLQDKNSGLTPLFASAINNPDIMKIVE